MLFVYLFIYKKTNAYLIKNIGFNYVKEGSDNRFCNNITEIDYNILYKINTNMKKQWLLNKLEDKTISVQYKLKILEYNEHNIIPPNLIAGNIMKNSDFDF
jgi:hypothetical protein